MTFFFSELKILFLEVLLNRNLTLKETQRKSFCSVDTQGKAILFSSFS